MPSAFSGSLKELKNCYKNNSMIEVLSENYRNEFGQSSDSQIKSWENSIPFVLDALDDPRFDNIQILVEYKMPIGEERSDMILLGGSENNKKGIIIELKQISDFDFNEETQEHTFFRFNRFGHPAEQVLSYYGRLKHLHSFGQHYDWKPVLMLHNLNSQRSEDLYLGRYENYNNEVITYYKQNYKDLGDLSDEFC